MNPFTISFPFSIALWEVEIICGVFITYRYIIIKRLLEFNIKAEVIV